MYPNTAREQNEYIIKTITDKLPQIVSKQLEEVFQPRLEDAVKTEVRKMLRRLAELT